MTDRQIHSRHGAVNTVTKQKAPRAISHTLIPGKAKRLSFYRESRLTQGSTKALTHLLQSVFAQGESDSDMKLISHTP